MASYTVTLDSDKTQAVAWARRSHNKALNPNDGSHPDHCADDESFLQRVVNAVTGDLLRNTPALSRRQVFGGLQTAGLLSEVSAVVASQSAEIQNEWAVADRFHRTNGMLNAMWAALPSNNGKGAAQLDAELDALFEQFAAL